MQTCMNWYCVWICCVCTCESIDVMDVWMYEWDSYDCIHCTWYMNSMRKTWPVRWRVDRHCSITHSANLLEDDIIVNKSSRGRGKTRYKVATDVSWGWSSLLTQSLEEIAICRPAQSVPPLARFSSHAFLFYFVLKIPNFCLDRPFGFSIHREYIPFLCP